MGITSRGLPAYHYIQFLFCIYDHRDLMYRQLFCAAFYHHVDVAAMQRGAMLVGLDMIIIRTGVFRPNPPPPGLPSTQRPRANVTGKEANAEPTARPCDTLLRIIRRNEMKVHVPFSQRRTGHSMSKGPPCLARTRWFVGSFPFVRQRSHPKGRMCGHFSILQFPLPATVGYASGYFFRPL